MNCPNCKRVNRDDATHCFACRTPLGEQGNSSQPQLDQTPIYHQEIESTSDYYEEPSPYEPETPVYTQEEDPPDRSGDEDAKDDDDDEVPGYYVPEDLEDEEEEEVAIYETSEDDVELTPIYADDLEEDEENDEWEEVPDDEEEDEPGESKEPKEPEVPEVPELITLEPLPPDDDDNEEEQSAPTPGPPPPPPDELITNVPPEDDADDDELEFDDDEPDDDDDFVISSPAKEDIPEIEFDDEDDNGESDEEFEEVFFDESEEDEDFEIVTSKEIDPKKASNIALVRAILAKISNLKTIGKDVSELEQKMAVVLNTKDDDEKLIRAKACLEAVDKVDKETDQEIFEETAGMFHAMRARLQVLAKKGRNVNHYSDSVEDASQAISLCDFSKAERIINEVMAELDAI